MHNVKGIRHLDSNVSKPCLYLVITLHNAIHLCCILFRKYSPLAQLVEQTGVQPLGPGALCSVSLSLSLILFPLKSSAGLLIKAQKKFLKEEAQHEVSCFVGAFLTNVHAAARRLDRL